MFLQVEHHIYSFHHYDRIHTLLGRPPGDSYSFQVKANRSGFTLIFEDCSQEDVERLEREGYQAKLLQEEPA